MLVVPQQREAEAKAEMFCPSHPGCLWGDSTPPHAVQRSSLLLLAPNEERKTFLLGIQIKKKIGDSNPLKNKLSPPKRL